VVLLSVAWGAQAESSRADSCEMGGVVHERQEQSAPLNAVIPAQTCWQPEPPQARVTEGMAKLPDVDLWYWDTGGSGEPVVLLHPATGNGAIWGYQQPFFAEAGYRVIGYSRRHFYRSQSGPADRPGSASEDLHALVDWLGLDKFHLIGSAAGGFIVPDYALTHPDRLYSIVIASSLGGVGDPDYLRVTAELLPKGFAEMPSEFRELGPSYRAANPEGVARWLALEQLSGDGPRMRQPSPLLSWQALERVRTPALILGGDADLYMPPSRVRDYAAHLPNAELSIFSEAGHALYWEQPDGFNRRVLEFLAKHGP